MRILTRRTLLASLGTITIPLLATQDENYVLRSNATLVVLDVLVESGKGRRPIRGLRREQFALYEDGKLQTIKQFAATETPVNIGLVLDMSASMHRQLSGLRKAVDTFLEASNSLDEYFVVGFNDRTRFALPPAVLFSTSGPQIRAAVEALRAEGRTSLYDGTIAALSHSTKGGYERRVLVLISDGRDNASKSNLRDLHDRVRSTPVTIYTIGLFEPDDADQNSGVLKQIAHISGGSYSHPSDPQSIETTCLRIARDIRARYTLAYTPVESVSQPERVRKLRIAVSDGGHSLSVHSRNEILVRYAKRGN